MSASLERFTPQASQVLSLAHEEAERLDRAEVGSDHLVLALIRLETSVAGQILQSFGLEYDELSGRAKRSTARRRRPGEAVQLSSEIMKVLNLTVGEAERLGHDQVGTEHLLLAVMLYRKGRGFRLLDEADITLEDIREHDITLVEGPPLPRTDIPPPPRSTNTLYCPHDGSQLEGDFIAGVGAFRCPTCRGLHIRKVSFRKLYETANVPKPRALSAISIDPSASSGASFDCPDDGVEMVVRTVSDTQVELCPDCEAVWLDLGDLDAVWARYRPGAGPKVIPKQHRREVPSLRELAIFARESVELLIEGLVELYSDILTSRRGD